MTDEQLKTSCIHPDVEHARRAMRDGDRFAYRKMFERRAHLNEVEQVPYWETRWDALFMLIARRAGRGMKTKFPFSNHQGMEHL